MDAEEDVSKGGSVRASAGRQGCPAAIGSGPGCAAVPPVRSEVVWARRTW